MNKYLYEELEKKAKWEQQRLIPIVGHWYKISYEQAGKRPIRNPRQSYRLCTGIGNHEGANVYLAGIDLISNQPMQFCIYPDELRYAEWPETNKFHRFCLIMLYCQIGENPSKINIYEDFKLYVLMETILLPKVINAKTSSEAIHGANMAVEKGTKARPNHHPYGHFNSGLENKANREEVRKAFGWLLQAYRDSKR